MGAQRGPRLWSVSRAAACREARVGPIARCWQQVFCRRREGQGGEERTAACIQMRFNLPVRGMRLTERRRSAVLVLEDIRKRNDGYDTLLSNLDIRSPWLFVNDSIDYFFFVFLTLIHLLNKLLGSGKTW